MTLDPRAKPPETLRLLFKRYQKLSLKDIEQDESVLDFTRGLSDAQRQIVYEVKQRSVSKVNSSTTELSQAFAAYEQRTDGNEDNDALVDVVHEQVRVQEPNYAHVYFHADLPGLLVIPGLIPLSTQRIMLSRLLHRDLTNAEHTTNVHFHHDITYPLKKTSFFDLAPNDDAHITPRDPATHSPLTIRQFLTRRLRWLLLGGQYDWTAKAYPDGAPPPFPPDLAALLHGLFPALTPQAAIVNLYSPTDTLSLHRDVSEFCDAGLVSVSVGCDAIFIVALERSGPSINGDTEDNEHRRGENQLSQCDYAVLRLRSGDAVYMAGPARWAWHGVPAVLRGTCPAELESWPCDVHSTDSQPEMESKYAQWRGWMADKRINLNVRQMWDDDHDNDIDN